MHTSQITSIFFILDIIYLAADRQFYENIPCHHRIFESSYDEIYCRNNLSLAARGAVL